MSAALVFLVFVALVVSPVTLTVFLSNHKSAKNLAERESK